MATLSIPRPLRTNTPDLPDVPFLLQYLLAQFWLPIHTWFSQQLYRLVLNRCAAHPLVRIAQLYDPASLVAACQHYYHAPGTKGTPPTYTVEQLVRAEIVRAWADSCSDPELEWLLASNLLVRFFVGLPLLAPTPDHSTLNRFHAFLSEQAADVFFRDVLAFLDQLDPEDAASRPQIIDTFAMASPSAAAVSVAALLRDLTRRLAVSWIKQAPVSLQQHLPPLDLSGLSRMDAPRTPQQAQVRLEQAVCAATWVVEGLSPVLAALEEPLRTAVTTQVQAIVKVIADETTSDASGRVSERPVDAKGSYRIGSALDLQATFRKHEPDPAVFGSNAVISITSTRIRAALILTGSTPDSQAPAAVVRQLQAWKVPLPAVLIMDQAGGMGKTRAELDALSQGQTTMVAHIPSTASAEAGRLPPSAFVLSADGQTLTCPRGQRSTRQYRHSSSDGVRFTFGSRQCQG